VRLVGSGLAAPGRVKAAAFGAFAVAAAGGLVLAATTSWWLVVVGAVAILAAWFYTGGSRPYGYLGLGEVSVFVFFGLVAVVGTTYVQTEEVTAGAVLAGGAVGALACAILVANNLRDIPTDRVAEKRTLAVVLGDRGTRTFYVLLQVLALVLLVLVAALETWWVLLGLVAVPWAARATVVVRRGGIGRQLIPVLRDTGLAELMMAAGMCAGLVIAS
jgi:1,4-dihydroxy-2-naphthoate octaprenyltransferase